MSAFVPAATAVVTILICRWIKQSGYDTPSLAHLKRIRKTGSTTTLLISTLALIPDMPLLPEGLALTDPYTTQVPRSAALTSVALQHKSTFWPTIFAPRKKYEIEPWSRGRAHWAWQAMVTVVGQAKAAKANGEVSSARRSPAPGLYPNLEAPCCRTRPCPLRRGDTPVNSGESANISTRHKDNGIPSFTARGIRPGQKSSR